MKVTILISCLHDLYYVNIKQEKFGDDWNCPTLKNWVPITMWWDECSYEEYIFLLKTWPVSSAQGQFLMWFLDSPPKKSTKVQIFMKIGLIELKLWKFHLIQKIQNGRFSKKALKLPNFKSQYLRNNLELGEKILLTFVSYK